MLINSNFSFLHNWWCQLNSATFYHFCAALLIMCMTANAAHVGQFCAKCRIAELTYLLITKTLSTQNASVHSIRKCRIFFVRHRQSHDAGTCVRFWKYRLMHSSFTLRVKELQCGLLLEAGCRYFLDAGCKCQNSFQRHCVVTISVCS